jgi:hypothetical protein
MPAEPHAPMIEAMRRPSGFPTGATRSGSPLGEGAGGSSPSRVDDALALGASIWLGLALVALYAIAGPLAGLSLAIPALALVAGRAFRGADDAAGAAPRLRALADRPPEPNGTGPQRATLPLRSLPR